MKRLLRRLITSCERDDLFLRVVFVLSGLLFGGLGVVTLVFVSPPSSEEWAPPRRLPSHDVAPKL